MKALGPLLFPSSALGAEVFRDLLARFWGQRFQPRVGSFRIRLDPVGGDVFGGPEPGISFGKRGDPFGSRYRVGSGESYGMGGTGDDGVGFLAAGSGRRIYDDGSNGVSGETGIHFRIEAGCADSFGNILLLVDGQLVKIGTQLGDPCFVPSGELSEHLMGIDARLVDASEFFQPLFGFLRTGLGGGEFSKFELVVRELPIFFGFDQVDESFSLRAVLFRALQRLGDEKGFQTRINVRIGQIFESEFGFLMNKVGQCVPSKGFRLGRRKSDGFEIDPEPFFGVGSVDETVRIFRHASPPRGWKFGEMLDQLSRYFFVFRDVREDLPAIGTIKKSADLRGEGCGEAFFHQCTFRRAL